MGVYLSSPVTEKKSADKGFGKYKYGVSSMQGWRMTQEDSHNCMPDFDPETETSYFAVYDGHGGAEVAQYCSNKLPDFLKSTLPYKEGQLSEALQDAFLGFDATLRDEEVIKELKSLAGVDDDGDEDEDDGDPVGRTEADLLRAEADIPIEELVAKYGDGMTSVPARKFMKDSNEKFLSPMIKAKRTGAQTDDNECEVADKNNSASSSGLADSLVTRLDDKLANGHADNENNLNTEKELREAESVNSNETEAMETNSDSKKTNSIEDSKENCIPDSSDVSNSVENVNNTETKGAASKADSSEADSTSVNDSEANAKPDTGERSESKEDSTPSSSSDGPSGSGCQEPSGSGEPSGASGPSASKDADSKPSGSGEAPSESAAGSSGEGSSGSGSGPSGSDGGSKPFGKPLLDEDFESDDESSDDNEYMEDSEEEDEEDEEDEELDEEEKQRIGGIFSKVIAGHDEEDGHIEEPGSDSGCTAVVALLRKDELVVANAGDSRCVLCRDGKAIDLSIDHKPEDDEERRRIEGAGGKVTADGRVNGGLNLSRALGDHWYKRNDSLLPQEQMISAWPDIQNETIGELDEFMVIACDGIWNYMTSQEVVEFVRERLKDEEKRKKPSLVCEEMFDYCLAPNTMGDGTGCDNMTCIIVVLNARTDTQSLKQSDCSEADSSSKEDTSVDKQTGVSDQQEPASSSSGEMDTQQESGSGTEKQTDSEKQGDNDKGTEKRPRENCVADSPSKSESQPEKRARLEESTVT